MNKRIVLCADDYGQAITISQGILHLIKHNRLSATSCMANTSHWSQHAKWLMPYQHQIDIGLHFNLTSGRPLSPDYVQRHGHYFFVLPVLLRKAFLRKLDQSAVEAECHAQIDSFQDAMGFLPHYIDGHQHVHQFPVIREAVVAVYERRLRQQKAYIRSVRERIKAGDLFFDRKKIIIQATGARVFERLLAKNKIFHNQSFAGIYPFEKSDRYAQFFVSFLRKIEDKGLVLCHPGWASSDVTDPLAKTRYSEYQYLISAQFVEDCRAQGVVLHRFH